jgi:hypothetical protein
VAHEACLLEWIADLQRPENNPGGKIACPQCKTQIRLKERRSIVLELVEGFSRVVGRAVPVLLLAGLYLRTSCDIRTVFGLTSCVGVGSVVFVGCTVYGIIWSLLRELAWWLTFHPIGVNTIYAVCGPTYANQILLGRNAEFSWTWRMCSVGPHDIYYT